jgi:signal peptidase II
MKDHMEKELPETGEQKRLNGLIRLRKHHNRGAFLNAGQRRQQWVALLSVLLTLVVAVLFVCSLGTRGNVWLRTGLSLLLGGAFSNTYDRLKRKYVVDYFSFGVKWKWLANIIFNISDFAIIIGALMAALSVETGLSVNRQL